MTRTEIIKKFHTMLNLIMDCNDSDIYTHGYQLDIDNHFFRWNTESFNQETLWQYQLSFPSLWEMINYINQQIEIHEQFLARFSE